MTKDWICSVKWVQATPTDGGWIWTMYLVDSPFPKEANIRGTIPEKDNGSG